MVFMNVVKDSIPLLFLYPEGDAEVALNGRLYLQLTNLKKAVI
jgi:hypothetical protein